jgi:ribosomal protein S11
MEIVIKVNSTYNNTIVSALYRGKILKTLSTGSLGFKKAKRASTLAAQSCGESLASWLLQLNKNLALMNKTRKATDLGSPKVNQSKAVSAQSKGERSNQSLTESKLSLLQEAKKKLSREASGGANKKESLRQNSQSQSKGMAGNELPKGSDSSKAVGLNQRLSVTPEIGPVSLLIAGVGYGKFGVIRGLSKFGIKIKTISDVTAIPHNGCKPPKQRRK